MWTFFISTLTAPPATTGAGVGRGSSVGGPIAADGTGEAGGEGSGRGAGPSGAAAAGAGDGAEAAAGGGAPAASAGTGARAACRKHAQRLPAISATTVVAWEYLTTMNRSINRANFDAARKMLSLVRLDGSHRYHEGKRLR
jgi:hypothetical protein